MTSHLLSCHFHTLAAILKNKSRKVMKTGSRGMAAIECIELTKTYGRRTTALHNLTLTIDEGTSFGLLGENGAGKSTLVRIIMGFIFPSSGRIAVLGEEQVARAHERIGYVHERPIFEHRFSGRAYLTYLARLSGMWD